MGRGLPHPVNNDGVWTVQVFGIGLQRFVVAYVRIRIAFLPDKRKDITLAGWNMVERYAPNPCCQHQRC